MKKGFLKLGLLLTLPLLLVGCGNDTKEKVDNDKVQVTVSISPLKEFVEVIGGDKVQVTSLVPDNVEAHDFEIKARDAEDVMNKACFIYNGAHMEDWLDELKETVSDSKVKFIDSSVNSEIIKEDGKEDPHLWLSLKEAQNQCKTIMEALSDADSENKEYYEENYNKYVKELDNLYNEYLPKFESLSNKYFITGHEAFGYLCRDFGLEQKSLSDLYGEGEATAKTYESLAKFCNDNKIKTIFSESSETSEEAETLANEINGKVQSIYSLESKVKGKTYIEAMRYNCEKIYNSMK